MPNILPIDRERLVQCCRELCSRCEMGHEPWPDEDSEINHGTDQVGEQYIDIRNVWLVVFALFFRCHRQISVLVRLVSHFRQSPDRFSDGAVSIASADPTEVPVENMKGLQCIGERSFLSFWVHAHFGTFNPIASSSHVQKIV